MKFVALFVLLFVVGIVHCYQVGITNETTFPIISWGRHPFRDNFTFYSIDAPSGNVTWLLNTLLPPDPPIATDWQGNIFFQEQLGILEFTPAHPNATVMFNLTSFQEPTIYGYSSNLSQLILVLPGRENTIMSLIPGGTTYNTLITLSNGWRLDNLVPWSLFDDATNTLIYPVRAGNGSRFWGFIDVAQKALVQAYPHTGANQPCIHPLLYKNATNPTILCHDADGALWLYDITVSHFTPLPVNVRKFFRAPYASILAATINSLTNVWYGAVDVSGAWGVISVDFNHFYNTTIVVPLQIQVVYETLSIYYGATTQLF